MTQKTILLVDDDDDFMTLLRARCEAIGLNVVSARNLLSATMSVGRSLPDIVCVDVEMPTGNGLEYCAELAADPATAHIPVVVLTGKSDADTRSTCEQLGSDFVTKSGDYWRTLEPVLRQLSAESTAKGPTQGNASADQTNADVAASFSPKTLLVANSSDSEPKKIVIADDDQDMLQLLSERFSSFGHSVVGVDNALDAINMIHHVSPDLVCLDIGMPSGNGLSVCEMMASDEALRQIPIIVLTGRSDGDTIRRCHDMLVYYVQKSHDAWERVAPLATELLARKKEPVCVVETTDEPTPDEAGAEFVEAEPDNLIDAVFAAFASANDANRKDGFGDPSVVAVTQRDVPWILCIDDDTDFSDALRIRLENHGVAVVRAFNGMDGYRLAFTSPASAILLDYHMPNGKGDYILGRLKDNPVTRNIPVLMITGMQDRVLQRRMLAMGAADFLAKPLDFEDLRDRLSRYIDILVPRPSRRLSRLGKGMT